MKKKDFYKLSRTLHIYVSSALFALLIMFCVTGILLNHSHWLSDDYKDDVQMLELPEELIEKLKASYASAKAKSLDTKNIKSEVEPLSWLPPINELQAYISKKIFTKNSQAKIQIDADMGEIIFDYKIPAGFVNVSVSADGAAQFEQRKPGALSVLNELHKGRNSGGVWIALLDIAAILILLFSLTGFIILIQNKKRRALGLFSCAMGMATPWIIYLFFVPRL